MKPITKIKTKRKDIVKNFILVAILSAGISLIANALTKESDLLVTLFPGAVCVIIVALFYLKEYIGGSSYDVNVESVISVDKEKNFIPIDRFRFSEDLNHAVLSVLSENNAYKPLWKQAFDFNINGDNKGQIFVKEFMEYLFIHWISSELNAYFINYEDCSKEMIGREQIPDLLIKNRVIELISKPYEEREKFQKEIIKEKQNEGKIVYMGGEDGVVYEMLEIELPRKSKVCREGDALVIKNRNFDIRFESDFKGFSTVLPRYFEDFYMKRLWKDTHNYLVNLKMSIRIKPFFLFSSRDLEYLGWLDRIGEGFIHYFSIDDFMSRIGYEQAATNHILYLNEIKGRVCVKSNVKDSKNVGDKEKNEYNLE